MGEVIPFPTPGSWSAREWFRDHSLCVLGHQTWKRMDRCTRSLESIALWRGMPHVVIDAGRTSGMATFGKAVDAMFARNITFERWSTLLYDRRYPVAVFRRKHDADLFADLLLARR